MTDNTSNIPVARTMYVEDPKSHRKFTVAYAVDGENMLVGVATCVPDRTNIIHSISSDWKYTTYETHVGDTFNKKKGRAIALGRLAKKPIYVHKPADSLPISAMLKHIADGEAPLSSAGVGIEESLARALRMRLDKANGLGWHHE